MGSFLRTVLKIIFNVNPLDKLNQEYYLALEKEFGLSTNLSAAIVKKQFKQ